LNLTGREARAPFFLAAGVVLTWVFEAALPDFG
ncbi:MAG: hypothetical protein JWL81_3529, partial [Verrucomicrobiales bacterium]|nr:hypothetical protein [Verrucomicrobiales bacterium]